MQTSIFRYLVPFTLILAVIGFVHALVTNPASIFRTFFFAALVIASVYLIYRWFFHKQTETHYSRYQRAAKQSIKRQKQKQKFRYRTSPHLKLVKSGKFKTGKPGLQSKQKKAHNFTVIEGKKNKKKNRALF